jgi:hypothetical protein
MKTEELNKALGAFLICFGQGLPAELKDRIRDRTYLMAEEIARNGEPNVAMLARGLADALSERLPTH